MFMEPFWRSPGPGRCSWSNRPIFLIFLLMYLRGPSELTSVSTRWSAAVEGPRLKQRRQKPWRGGAHSFGLRLGLELELDAACSVQVSHSRRCPGVSSSSKSEHRGALCSLCRPSRSAVPADSWWQQVPSATSYLLELQDVTAGTGASVHDLQRFDDELHNQAHRRAHLQVGSLRLRRRHPRPALDGVPVQDPRIAKSQSERMGPAPAPRFYTVV